MRNKNRPVAPVHPAPGPGPALPPLLIAVLLLVQDKPMRKQEPTCGPCPPSSWTWSSPATSPYCCPVIGVGFTNEKQEPTCGPCPPSSWTWPCPTTFFLTLSTQLLILRKRKENVERITVKELGHQINIFCRPVKLKHCFMSIRCWF